MTQLFKFETPKSKITIREHDEQYGLKPKLPFYSLMYWNKNNELECDSHFDKFETSGEAYRQGLMLVKDLYQRGEL